LKCDSRRILSNRPIALCYAMRDASMVTRPQIQLLDTVALVCDVPKLGLAAGEVGAVVDLLSDDAFEVEFCDESGYTYGLHTLRADQLVRLHTEGHPLRTRLEAA
jgi:uncharacterized protein DUF4926